MNNDGSMKKTDNPQPSEAQQLAERAQSLNRRSVLKAGQALAFLTPAIAIYGVPRHALGQTGSGTPASFPTTPEPTNLLVPSTFDPPGLSGQSKGKASGKAQSKGK